jgi:HEPN domain.
MNKDLLATNLIHAGYLDYIAARFLLNNDFIIQGATLASSAVEKYLKAVLVLTTGSSKKIHLDRFAELKDAFKDSSHNDLLNHLDDIFLEILGKIYRFRYYDNIRKPDSTGFFVNQFLGELDYTVCAVELLIKNGNGYSTEYSRAAKDREPNLMENNYRLNNWVKEEFMVRKSQAYAIYVNPNRVGAYVARLKEQLHVPYLGKIMTIVINDANDK